MSEKSLGDCRGVRNIKNCKKFSQTLRDIDRLRNISAHGHTTGSYEDDLKEKIEEAIKVVKPIMAY